MSEEKELVKKRGSFKGRLTAFVNYLDAAYDKQLSSCEVKELQLRTGRIEALYEQYDEVQLRLECLVEDVKAQFTERADFESIYYKALSRSQELLCKYINTNDSIGSDKSTHASQRKPVKLPTIQLPKFNGDYSNWLEFRDTFTSLIHRNDEIDSVNKFHYLRASLEGSAAVVIHAIDFSASNYDIAWQLICDRFDNKRLLIQNHVSSLFNVNAVVKESSVAIKGLIDQLNKNLRALDSLGEPVKHWDTLLIHIVTRKLDTISYREWEQHKGRLDKDITITFDAFIQFLRTRADLLETLELARSNNNPISHKPNFNSNRMKSMVISRDSSSSTELNKSCPHCKGDHSLSNCSRFLSLSVDARLKLVPNYKLCYNCFSAGHFANRCKKPGCKICKRRHNTLLHSSDNKGITNVSNIGNNKTSHSDSSHSVSTSSPIDTAASTNASANNLTCSADLSSSCGVRKQRGVLLSTALIKLCDQNDREHIVRAMLDSGSTSCFMTERLCKQLNLNTSPINGSVYGINNVSSRVGKICQTKMTSLDNNYSFKFHCFILPSLTTVVPCREIDMSDLNIPNDICLADPTFYKPSEVDVLIGADLFWDLVGSQRIRLGIGKPILCETLLGWIVSGPVTYNTNSKLMSHDNLCNYNETNSSSDYSDDIRSDLVKFWNLEEVNSQASHYLPEEKLCEDHFVKNTTRLEDGHFCVRIPLKQSPSVLGESFQRASKCLYSLERRLKSKPDFGNLYRDFMSEYRNLGHMTESNNNEKSHGYFIPHHGVLRECSTTTKLRVVFNASCATSSGVSFNDVQMVGPTVQDDLMSILLRFRHYKYVMTADVAKMYRCIYVHPSDRHLQQVLWRDSLRDPVKVYKLNTVTYGTASAPFLATRCLKQIGLDYQGRDNISAQSTGESYLSMRDRIADVIKHDFYVDDLLTGGDNLEEVKFIRTEVINALSSACMPLRKWRSNVPELVSGASQSSLDLDMGSNESNKLLGLNWFATSDELGFSSSILPTKRIVTKRDVLGAIARIFDPLGLLSPCVVIMKMFLQRMWLDKLSWDDSLPPVLNNSWNAIVKALPLINDFRIPRLVVCDVYTALELHVFTDASERAYGACVYVRSTNNQGNCMVRLLVAKSRVAPIKPTTIPRLELCGAVIGARLCEKVVASLRLQFTHVYCWTDSTIVLGWLQMLPSKLQPFVRNRVAEVLDKTGHYTWRHVPTNKNPADLISRGVEISALHSLDLWWSGPSFLNEAQSHWPSPRSSLMSDELPETRPHISLSTNIINNNHTQGHTVIDFSRFSSYLRLIRSVATVLRFIKKCKRTFCISEYNLQTELQDALHVIIIRSQIECFPEYNLLINNQKLPNKSALLKFNVFLDSNKIMRVGGRLANSTFSFDKKHPIILQSTHKFTKLLFEHEHIRLMHAGPQLLLASIRDSYWPIGGRSLAKSCYRNCVRCCRESGRTVTPVMGNLPQERLLPGGFPFTCTGVDYAGPIMAASRQGRGCRLVKVYIAIFVCFTTKAIHLELVSDLTSHNYLLALKRFIARRGKPSDIYSDNGTSFVGACNELSKFLKSNCSSLGEQLANDGIKFHFIPAYTPHFGGLWEAGVKSTKYHLRRVLGNCHLTYEEINTTLVQIEAILNSRPLTPLSSDPADFTPLTPGHFLVGRPLTSFPQQDVQDYAATSLSRFQRIEQLRQHFWARWSKEFVSELQQRIKWHTCKDTLKLGSLVVIKEDNLPPLKWKLGRIVAVHPGSDGIIRVADIRTTLGVIRRAFNRICPLPIDSALG